MSNQDDVGGGIGDRDAVEIADDMTDDDNWTGGFYELCLVLGASDDGTGFAAVELGVGALHEHGHLCGTLALPSGARVVCGAFLSRHEDLDTLELYLPLGALTRVDKPDRRLPLQRAHRRRVVDVACRA